MRVRVLRVQLNCSRKTSGGLVELSGIAKCKTQVAVRIHVVGRDVQRSMAMVDCLVQLRLVPERFAQITEGLGTFGLQIQRPSKTTNCLIEPALVTKDHAET